MKRCLKCRADDDGYDAADDLRKSIEFARTCASLTQ
jgi:hypothetical protein